MLRWSCLLLAILLSVALPIGAEEDNRFADVEIKTTRLTDNLARLEGSGGNLAVCWGEDGIFLVDDQFAPLTERILAAIAELSDGPVRFVFNTHWHGDHTGGNENLGDTGSLIFSHANVRRRLSTEQFTAIWDRTTPPSPAVALPVVTFNDSLTLHLNGLEIRAFHVPHGHTDGDGVIHFVGADVIHAGDLVFSGLYPYIDVSAGGSIDGIIAGVETIIGLCGPETRVIAGHGPVAGIAELQTYLAMLQGVRGAVAEAKRGGADLETVQAARPAAPWDADWGQTWLTSDQFTAMVFESLPGQ